MKVVYGDLIKLVVEEDYDMIVHGCNCFCKMKRGVAKDIAEMFPVAKIADDETKKGDIAKLGTITCAGSFLGDKILYIVNAYTQFKYGTDKKYVDYAALRECFKKVAKIGKERKIIYPQIGSGLAGGDWEKIKSIIVEELEGLDHTCVYYKKTGV